MRPTKLAIGLAFLGIYPLLTNAVSAAEGLQNRDNGSFKNSLADGCVKIQTAAMENARVPTSILRAYCTCIAENLAGQITQDEMSNLAADKQLPSFAQKQKIAVDYCVTATLLR
jgi:hypothetical protein